MVLSQTMGQLTTNHTLKNHENVAHNLNMLMGKQGLLLGFTGDVWDLNCVRYVLWLQRQNFKLAANGINTALIVPNQSYELNGFFMSIPRKITFPLLADPKCEVCDEVGMERPGFALVNSDGGVLGRWYVTDTNTLSIRSVLCRLRQPND